MSFTYNPEDYQRNLNIVNAYAEQAAFYLSKQFNKPYDYCLEYVKKNIKPGGKHPLKDPEIVYLARSKTGDRNKRTGTLLDYIKMVTDNKLIIAPTMTVYLNPLQKRSFLAEYIIGNMKGRKVQKDLKFTAMMAGDKPRATLHDNIQNSLKIKNNSMSGAHSSPSTPLYNKSSHSTLTSTCRISTSYANANNESFLAGNRHYWCVQVVLNHLVTTSIYTNMENLKIAMDTYNLHYPTPQEVMDCITYSTDLYWKDTSSMNEIAKMIDALTPLERAAFVYVGDLFHLSKYNEEVVKTFLSALSKQATHPAVNPKEIITKADGELVTMVCLICSEIMDGRTLKVLEKEDPNGYGIVAATVELAEHNLSYYQRLITGLWRPDTLTPSIAVLPSIIRRAVVTSDTDSTIFTNQYWTSKMSPDHPFSKEAYNTGYVTTFLTSQLVKHRLALMSANIGAVPEHIHSISMKNEYYFPVFALTSQAKHYYAYRSAQEGNVFKELQTEIKGVHLRDSTAPPEVTKTVKLYIESIMDTLLERGRLTVDEVFGVIAKLEHSIIDEIEQGGFTYMKSMQVKTTESYVQGDKAPNYQHYLFWDEVFGSKYGIAPQPPFQAIKVSVDLDNKTKIKEWLDNIKDRDIAAKLEHWIKRTGKSNVTTFVLPLINLQAKGIPREVTQAINLRKLVKNITSPFYLLLESLGIFMANDNITRLVSDTYK